MKWRHAGVLLLDARQKRFNAGPKARIDTAHFLGQAGFRIQMVPTSRSRHWQRLFALWMSLLPLVRFRPGEVVWCQFPCDMTTLAALKKARRQGHKTVAFVHDLEGLKADPVDWGKVDQEAAELCKFDAVLGLNQVMGDMLQARGVRVLSNLGMWDYVCQLPLPAEPPPLQGLRVVFAGSLAPDKCSFIYQLGALENVQFDVYGEGLDLQKPLPAHVRWHPGFAPEKPPFAADGALGLVWDGADIDSCTGRFGAYLAFNTPHKASMYIAMGVPVVIWRGAALASLMEQRGAGILIDSLRDLPALLATLSPQRYAQLAQQARTLSTELRNGVHLLDAAHQLDAALPL